MKRSVKVDIFGHNYILKGDAEDRHIQRIAEFVDQKMREVSLSTSSQSTVNIAILAAINIADEYLRAMDDKNRAEAKARDLSHFLDTSI